MKPKKDVAFLCQFFYPEYISSATLPFDIAKRYAKAGYSVGALCGYPYEYFDKKVPCNETIENIEIKRLKYLKLKRSSKLGRLLNYFSFIMKAWIHIRYLKNYKTVIVFSNPPLLPWIAKMAKKRYGCRLIFVAYDLYPEIALQTQTITSGGAIHKIMEKVNKVFYANADAVVALSNEMREFIIQNREIHPNKVCVIPNWYKDEYNEFEIITVNDIIKPFANKIVVSYLGNMGTCQDIETLLKAAKVLEKDDRFIFLFAGHGNKVERIKEEIQKGAKNLVYYDFLHGLDYLSVLKITSYAVVSLEKGLHGLCVPSKTYAYMMYNKPLICIMDDKSDIAQDVLVTNSGIVVKNGESCKIASYLQEGEHSANIRVQYLKKYTPDVTLAQYEELLSCILKADQ